MIIKARAPLRIGLAGGGTDVSPYCDDYGGLVLNTTISRYAYATIETREDDIVQFCSTDKNHQSNFKITEKKSRIRGNIYDNNGYLIATTIRKYDLIVNPSVLRNPKKFESELKKIFGNKINFHFKDKLSSNLKYLKVKKNISLKDYNKILKIGEPGIKIEESYIRKYPGKSLASHVIGKVDVDGKGISGVEKKLNNELSSSKNIHLSIDSGIQNIFKQLLLEQIIKFQASAGAGIIMNANNGKIKSIISLPDYDNNINNNLSEKQVFKSNRNQRESAGSQAMSWERYYRAG